jgi:hypothetical protein
MAVAEVALKSPLIPLFQRGNFLRRTLTPPFDGLRADFGKEGKGRFFGGMRRKLCGELWFQDTRKNWISKNIESGE